ncbi:MAG: DEAD/DEAH box helicase [Bacteroidia bacterium]|nr:DEAD/DEAH box helicase [Bacteroidia bacterium]
MRSKRGFSRYELDERVLAALPKLGYKYPTLVQEKVIPLFIQKKNLLVEAPTGTGKTAAYGLPLISRLNLLKNSTQALILTPSRELAVQVQKALQSFYSGDKLKVGIVVGGTSMKESYDTIKSSPHILVAVPGRLKDVMSEKSYDFLWRDIKFLIVDEGDKMVEAGFQKDFDEIRERIRGTAQVGFFSATISPDSQLLIKERVKKLEIVRLSPKQMLKNIQFSFLKVQRGKRESFLVSMLKQEKVEKALIFAGRRQDIAPQLGFLRNCGLKAEAYHGNQEQKEREHILKRFKESSINYLLATDLAARGLDIEDLPAVINMSIPSEYDYYLHRVGRTGRAGNKGKVFNIVSGEMELVRLKRHHRVMELRIQEMQVELLDKKDLIQSKKETWVKYHFSRGKKDKIRKGDVVGFLLNHTALSSEQIGTISTFDSYTVVDMPQSAFHELKDQEGLKIKGKSLKIRKYSRGEEEKKAKAIKKLKQDRK